MTGILVQRFVLLGVLGALAACVDQANGGGAGSRDQIPAVGSSTVYPFTTMLAKPLLTSHPQRTAPVTQSPGAGRGDDRGWGEGAPGRTG